MTYQVSQRRAARLLPMNRGTLRYVARRDDQLALRRRLRELAAVRVRFGYRRLTVLLRREGWRVNAKRVWRLYREEGLTMRTKRRKKLASRARVPPSRATAPQQRWSMDFVHDRLIDGRAFRVLTVLDQFTRECVALVAAPTWRGEDVAAVLETVVPTHGVPQSITVACYDQVVKALGAVGLSNRGTDTGTGSLEPAHRASSGLIPEERRVPGGRASSCLRLEGLRTTVGMASSPAGAGASGL